MGERGSEGSKLRHPTRVTQIQVHTPKSSTLLSSQQDCVPGLHAPPTTNATSHPPATPAPRHCLRLRRYEFPRSQRVAGCWLGAVPDRPPSTANANPGHSGKGGVHSSRKQWLGEGCELMLHILWICAHGREEEAVRAHPPTTACEHAAVLYTFCTL